MVRRLKKREIWRNSLYFPGYQGSGGPRQARMRLLPPPPDSRRALATPRYQVHAGGGHRSDLLTFDHFKASGPCGALGASTVNQPARAAGGSAGGVRCHAVVQVPTADTPKPTVECTARVAPGFELAGTAAFVLAGHEQWPELDHRANGGTAGDLGEALPSTCRRRSPFAGDPDVFFLTENRGSSRQQNRTRGDSALASASRLAKKIS
jgi:hypothetical protein